MAFADAQSAGVVFYGEAPATIKLAGTVSRGDALGYSGGWKRALATVGSVVQMRCVAGEDGVSGQHVTAYFGDSDVGGRFSGATVGGAVYVEESTGNGKYTQTLPSTTGDSTKVVGYAVSATRLHINGNMNTDSVA